MAAPTDQELLVIALTNRARLDPAAEAALFGISLNEGPPSTTITADSKQPLAFDTSLTDAARAHSQAMITQDFFAHTNPFTNSTPQTRGNAAGYSGGVGENISARGFSGAFDITATAIQQHEDLFVDTGIAGRGHRLNILNASYQQIGVGIATGVTNNIFGGTFNTQTLTQDFGIPNAAGQFITGIVYTDTGDNFYSVGEGRSGVTVTTAAGNATTIAAGGYSRSISSGVQAITFSGGGLTSTISLNATVTAGRNILIDVVGQSRVETSTSLDEVANIDTIVGLGTIGLALRGAGGNDSVFGAKGADTLGGGVGNDILKGGLGNDSLDGGNDTDTALFTGNRNTYTVTQNLNGSWTITGADGTDTLTNVEFGQFNDITIALGGGVNPFDGDGNDNLIDGDGGNNTINGFGGNDTLNGNDGDDVVNGGDTNDTITGGNGNDSLNGDNGNDSFDGGAGNDRMTGGLGNDTYNNVEAGDTIIEASNGGSDTVRTALNSYTLPANVERVDFIGVGNFVGIGNSGHNRFTGGSNDDRFVDVAGGNDTISGGGGSDSVDFRSSATGATINLLTGTHGGAAAGDFYASIEKFFGSNTAGDSMTGGAGRANFSGFGGNDTLTGGNNIDALQGNAGNDVLSGLGGVDSLDGGAGNDTMTGGLGVKDYFIYSAAGFGQDGITDFEDNLDKLKVHSSVATSIAAFNITGNGTTNVLLTQISSPTNTITLQSASAITITATDFLFY